eukprot:Phypoly_transcript_15664.p1 GENE.Phypoly_transcript_15664~~Phypoly_transcript_15664.p1  ORF type:complete len:122 (+),score=18.14 Phypoly_transcript_15664:448-813(+)
MKRPLEQEERKMAEDVEVKKEKQTQENGNEKQKAQNTPNQAPPPIQRKPEPDHSRQYVKKIKTRFLAQPEVYPSFLDILHSYHKKQHTLSDVHDQVHDLFEGHNDLIEEFGHFLPNHSCHA